MSDAFDLDAIERYWVLEERGRPGLAQRDVAALVAEVRRLRAENARMLNALRAVRSDRPTAHSDEVWRIVNDALERR